MNVSDESVQMESLVASSGLFDRWDWLYAFFRERLFANHADLIAGLMRARPSDPKCATFIELGCGPGFYSAQLARKFPHWKILGLDTSARLLERARRRVAMLGLSNCRFELADVTQLSGVSEHAAFILASRLFLVLRNRSESLNGIYNLLRPGGALLIAEPKENWRTELPLNCMKALDRFTIPRISRQTEETCRSVSYMELDNLLAGQRWSGIRRWTDKRYQYALCEKPSLNFREKEIAS